MAVVSERQERCKSLWNDFFRVISTYKSIGDELFGSMLGFVYSGTMVRMWDMNLEIPSGNLYNIVFENCNSFKVHFSQL